MPVFLGVMRPLGAISRLAGQGFEWVETHRFRVKQDEVHPVDLNYAVAKAHRGVGNPDQALAAARKCLEMDPEFCGARPGLTRAHARGVFSRFGQGRA